MSALFVVKFRSCNIFMAFGNNSQVRLSNNKEFPNVYSDVQVIVATYKE